MGPEGSHRGEGPAHTQQARNAHRRGSGQNRASVCMPETNTSHRTRKAPKAPPKQEGSGGRASPHESPQGRTSGDKPATNYPGPKWADTNACEMFQKDMATPSKGHQSTPQFRDWEVLFASKSKTLRKGNYPGKLKKSMEIHGNTRKSMEIHGHPWKVGETRQTQS